MTPTKNKDYTEHDKVARAMGLKGKNGHYATELGVTIDTTASEPNRLAFGYLIAKSAGHITKW